MTPALLPRALTILGKVRASVRNLHNSKVG